MSDALWDLLDGMLASADERLAPEGLDMSRHYLLVARRFAETEVALSKLDAEPSPFENQDTRLRVSAATFAVVEAALAYWGLAVRLRARFTGQHARLAGEPLKQGLRHIARNVDDTADGSELLGNAARALAFVSGVVEAAEHAQHARSFGLTYDEAIQRFVAIGVISLLRVAAAVQEDSELR
ncbi:hypothetical protein DSM112329_02686 [Paraconexibacter sp. AEG42_29]|uniref:Abortive infection protein-like C-terminal domain-containing protein n=1 Tax=Paraconexibacter sp. AEG42_29 TaxID=2997339 RepID=A0AAU7AW55_9ACTN